MAALLLLLAVGLQPLSAAPTRPNVLYVVIDDLRIDLPVYGQSQVHAPNLARLAREGLVFDSAYCNQPVCSPSRNSFMSGRRPSTTQIWNFHGSFRDVGPAWTTLPGHFMEHGFLTLGTGKLFHPGSPNNGDGSLSWSDAPGVQFVCNDSNVVGPPGTYCMPGAEGCRTAGTPGAPKPRWCSVDIPLNGSTGNRTLADATTVADATAKLRYAAANLAATGQPFFLGVGLQKPHLDFMMPAGFLELYPPNEQTRVAKHPTAQAGRPPVSIHCPYEGASFEKLWKGWGYTNPWTPMREVSAQQMRRYYWAATSFMDYLVGQLLGEIEAAGLTPTTLVVFHSDHGWSLGENGDWLKFSLTELGTRVPLIIKAPHLPHAAGRRTSALVELVDVMPSISELAGLPAPTVRAGDAPLDGISFAPLFGAAPPAQLKPHVWAQYPRCPANPDFRHQQNASDLWHRNMCINTPSTEFQWMGYSLRTATWRYNAWFRWNGTRLSPIVPPGLLLLGGSDSHGGAAAGPPPNGTNGFYNELFQYQPPPLTDLDSLELVEMGAANPAVVAAMHATLLTLIL